MRSAVDSNVLLDVFGPSREFGPGSRRLLQRARAEGALIACDVVWAETRSYFHDAREFERAMQALEIEFDPCDESTSALTGEAWRAYRRRGGARTALVPDFLVAAHASLQADRLITRDRGFLRRAFAGLRVLDPTES